MTCGFEHLALVVSDMDQAFERLRALKVQFVSTGPQRLPDWNPTAAGIKAFYFRDPDQHTLEVIWFPPGKRDPRWQRRSDNPFLGIDHTAIAVSDSAVSFHFYGELLGLRKVGGGENYGPEQEHLNQVFGARVRITSLRVASGPGIEFLEYLTPRGGRPRPADARANDLLHWPTTLVTPDLDALAAKLRSERVGFVSPGVTLMAEGKLGFSRGVLVGDPDGHAVLLIQEGR